MTTNKPARELAERFLSGDKKELYDGYLSTLVADELPITIDDYISEVTALQDQLVYLTGGNREFLESFATGIYRGVNMKQLNRRASETNKLNVSELRKNLLNQRKNELFNLYSQSHISKLKNSILIEYR